MIRGLPRDPGRRFGDLAAAVDYAKTECAAEPALLELIVGDFHVIARQASGWSRPLFCRSAQRLGASATACAEPIIPMAD